MMYQNMLPHNLSIFHSANKANVSIFFIQVEFVTSLIHLGEFSS